MDEKLAARRNHVWDAVEEFWRHLASHVPKPDYVVQTDRNWSDSEWRDYRRKTRCYEGSGVYIHFSEAGEILYIGVTLAGLDRCWANDSAERRFIDALRFHPDWEFLAPALEVFLIRNPKTRPKYNRLHQASGDVGAA
jgi:hypothetical protein